MTTSGLEWLPVRPSFLPPFPLPFLKLLQHWWGKQQPTKRNFLSLSLSRSFFSQLQKTFRLFFPPSFLFSLPKPCRPPRSSGVTELETHVLACTRTSQAGPWLAKVRSVSNFFFFITSGFLLCAARTSPHMCPQSQRKVWETQQTEPKFIES